METERTITVYLEAEPEIGRVAEPKSGIFKCSVKDKRQHPGDPVRRPVRAFLPAFQHRLLARTHRLPDDTASRDRFYLLSASPGICLTCRQCIFPLDIV